MSTNISITHDLHQHSITSFCCSDKEMIPQRLLSNAVENGYDTICITDHVWDALVPGASKWYSEQPIEHVCQSLPLPSAEGIRFCFGCETEYCGGEKLGLARSSFSLFDFVVIPINHFHMLDFVRPSSINTAILVADLLLTRLEELQQLDLPWEKIGIAHLTSRLAFREGNVADVYDYMPEDRLLQIFGFFAQYGTGIELNACSFRPGWEERFNSLMRPYSLAKQAGCKFYFASDAHKVSELSMMNLLHPAINALDLRAEDLYRIP
ncbi:MAG TPA: PHP domain-containing protein [Clostridiales bacterium]|nr:PHP domain-containing protein [Clostridiales bacterium]